MDFSKKGAAGTLRLNKTRTAQLMQGIGSTACAMADNGAARMARVKAPVARCTPGSTMGAVDPRCVTPAEDTQEPSSSE